MLSQFTPKERVLYALLVAALLGCFSYVGAQRLRANPELKLEPAAAPGEPAGPMAAEASKEVVVHVVGAVNRPGVVRLDSESRVQEAIAKAGGAKGDAALSEINLAAKLVDGTQLLVPRKSEAADVAEPYRGGGSDVYRSKPASSGGSTRSAAPSSVNLNSANASQLDRLPGVGPATAAKILEYRQAHGGFTSVDELLAVKGIGPKKLAAMRKFVRL